jgi:Tol biopolymer transport system component
LPRRGYRFIGAVNSNGQALAADAGTPAFQVKPRRRSALSVLAASIAVVALALWWVSRIEPPPPRITSTVQLTSDGQKKCEPLATDGLRVYFSEFIDGGCKVMAVSVSGGQTIPIHTPFPDAHLLNISPDLSQLLVGEGEPSNTNTHVAHGRHTKMPLWSVPTMNGVPRRLGNIVAGSGSWSPNGQKFAYTNGSALYVANADGTGPHELVAASSSPTAWAWWPVWSPDGNRLRFTVSDDSTGTGSLWEISAEGKDMHQVFPQWQNPSMQCCGSWTRDERYYLFVSWKQLIGSGSSPAPDLWALREPDFWFRHPGGSSVQLTAGPVHFMSPIPSFDGKLLFAISPSTRGELTRYDRKTQRFSPYLSGVSAHGVSFSKDGAWMTYVTFPQGQLWRCRTDGSEALQLTFSPLIVHDPHWSPDGKQIVYSGANPGGEWQIYVVSRDGSISQRVLPDSEIGIDSTWSADGNSILFGQPSSGDNTVVHNFLQIFDLKTRRISVVPGSEGLRSPRFSPDGKYISAVTARDFRLMLFDVAAQKWTAQGPTNAHYQSWSRDSRYVYFLRPDVEPAIFRVAVDNNKLERITSLKDFRMTGPWGVWLSLTPDGDPLVLRDIGPPEIYALSWEAP